MERHPHESPRHEKYLDEVKDDVLRKDLVYTCEASLPDVEPADDENTRELIMHERMFNRLMA